MNQAAETGKPANHSGKTPEPVPSPKPASLRLKLPEPATTPATRACLKQIEPSPVTSHRQQRRSERSSRNQHLNQSVPSHGQTRPSGILLTALAMGLLAGPGRLLFSSIDAPPLTQTATALLFTGLLTTLFLRHGQIARVTLKICLAGLITALTLLLFTVYWPAQLQTPGLNLHFYLYPDLIQRIPVAIGLLGWALILHCHGSKVRLTTTLCAVTIALALLWLPKTGLAPLRPLTLHHEFHPNWMTPWRLVELRSDYAVWKNPGQPDDFLRASYFPESRFDTLSELENKVEKIAEEAGLGPLSVLPVAGRDNHVRYLSLGPNQQALDARAFPATDQQGYYLLLFQVRDYPLQRKFISEIFELFQ